MIWLVVGSLVPSVLVSWIAAHFVRRYAERWALIDRPSQRKTHTRVTPTAGGLAIWLGIVVPLVLAQLLVWAMLTGRSGDAIWQASDSIRLPDFLEPHLEGFLEQSGKLWLLLGAGTALLILGLVDDLRGLDWRFRLCVQTLVALVMVANGWRLSVFIDEPWITGTLSVVWTVGLINSFNMLDNMDGLSAGVAAIAASILAAVMLLAPDPLTHQPQLFVGGFLLVLIGSLLGFLWHNRPPARLFMGDAGSYLIGFLLAMCTMIATFSGGDLPRHSILVPICVLAVPIYDTCTVLAIRLREGRSLFGADRRHFSHRLVEMGLSKTQALLTIYLATATTGLGALLLYQVNAAGAAVILLMVACVLTLIGILETAGLRSINHK